MAIDVYSKRGQEVVLVLFALRQLGSIRSKEEVLRYIRERRFNVTVAEEAGRYEGKNEPKAETLLCYARQDAVEHGWMFSHDEKDAWELTRSGGEFLGQTIARFRTKELQIRDCAKWAPHFKTLIDPAYTPMPTDPVVPRTIRERAAQEDLMKWLLS